MTAVTVGKRVEVTGIPGMEVVYVTNVVNGYTFASKFGSIESAIFSPTTAAAAGCTWSGGTVTFATGATLAGVVVIFGK